MAAQNAVEQLQAAIEALHEKLETASRLNKGILRAARQTGRLIAFLKAELQPFLKEEINGRKGSD